MSDDYGGGSCCLSLIHAELQRSAASEHPNKTESRLDTDLGNLDIDFLKLDMDLGNLDMGFPQEMNLRKI